MGGCVVPPGTAAMCQTGGEERERTSKRECKRGRERVGREKEDRDGERMKKKKKPGKMDTLETLPSCPSAVSQTYRTHLVGIVSRSVELCSSAPLNQHTATTS